MSTTTTTTTIEATRYYWRCTDCLAGTVTTETFGAEVPTICNLCQGPVRLLGPVDGIEAHWVRVLHLSPCDHRCTRARGRRCECECLGRMHGSGLVREVERIGGAIRLTPSFDAEAAIARAEEFRAIRQRIREALNARYGRCWSQYYLAAYGELANLATHQSRMKKAARLLREIARG
jgi:hypothetical protein